MARHAPRSGVPPVRSRSRCGCANRPGRCHSRPLGRCAWPAGHRPRGRSPKPTPEVGSQTPGPEGRAARDLPDRPRPLRHGVRSRQAGPGRTRLRLQGLAGQGDRPPGAIEGQEDHAADEEPRPGGRLPDRSRSFGPHDRPREPDAQGNHVRLPHLAGRHAHEPAAGGRPEGHEGHRDRGFQDPAGGARRVSERQPADAGRRHRHVLPGDPAPDAASGAAAARLPRRATGDTRASRASATPMRRPRPSSARPATCRRPPRSRLRRLADPPPGTDGSPTPVLGSSAHGTFSDGLTGRAR